MIIPGDVLLKAHLFGFDFSLPVLQYIQLIKMLLFVSSELLNLFDSFRYDLPVSHVLPFYFAALINLPPLVLCIFHCDFQFFSLLVK